MKWKLAAILFCYLLAAVFYAAWHFEVERRIANIPNRDVNFHEISWMMLACNLSLFVGTTVLAIVVAESVATYFRRES